MTARWFVWLDEQLTLGIPGAPATASDTAPILAVLSEPLGLPGASLPAYGVPGDGCCRDCLRPPVHAQGLCVYCAELARCAAPDYGDPGLARVAVLLLLLAAALLAVLWAAGVIT